MDIEKIRNFCIIAHIDHGKSTLADRLLEYTGTLSVKEMKDQVLDNMELERERGITIKSHPIVMNYTVENDTTYYLNLIDTPGHVDFSYEVSRTLAACEGALLVVDAVQGVEAQTISNMYLAVENNLKIIPVINKIDLPGARIEDVKAQIKEILGCNENDILLVSAKSGTGVEKILDAIVKRIPPPAGDKNAPLRALIFDSSYDSYRGVITYIRVFDGEISVKDKIKFFSNNKTFDVDEVGILRLKKIKKEKLSPGEVGYLICGAKNVRDTEVGDTITDSERPALGPLPGYKKVKPMVFSGLYPADAENYEELRISLEKLKLNDASLFFEPETSKTLGFGFRCGFLGLLHMEIVQERLEREYYMDIVTTVPNVAYKITLKNGKEFIVDNPVKVPSMGDIEKIEEPYISSQIITPKEYIGNIMKLSQDRRGTFISTEYLDSKRVMLNYYFPLSETIFDFYDKLKSVSRGYASFDYEHCGYRESKLVKLDILINGEIVDAFSTIIHKDKAYNWGKKLCKKLRELIPRQLFEVTIQGAIGSRIISRESIKPIRKNVTAKCYGGDITRKRKLLEKQKEGKKRMKQVGKVEIPQEAFLAVLKIS